MLNTLNGCIISIMENNVATASYAYYSLDELKKTGDIEMSEYKLFALANKCGFNRIDDS